MGDIRPIPGNGNNKNGKVIPSGSQQENKCMRGFFFLFSYSAAAEKPECLRASLGLGGSAMQVRVDL